MKTWSIEWRTVARALKTQKILHCAIHSIDVDVLVVGNESLTFSHSAKIREWDEDQWIYCLSTYSVLRKYVQSMYGVRSMQ